MSTTERPLVRCVNVSSKTTLLWSFPIQLSWIVNIVVKNTDRRTLILIAMAFCADDCLAENPQIAGVGHMIGEEILAQNQVAVRKRAAMLNAEDRYEYLYRWVILGDAPSEVRLTTDFTPTMPVPSNNDSSSEIGRRIPSGGRLVSPAMDLISVAAQLQRLNELRTVVKNFVPLTHEQQKCRQSFLAILAMAETDFDIANDHLKKLFDLAQTTTQFSAERYPEAAATWSAAKYPDTFAAARDLAFLLYEQTRNGNGPRSERWHRHIYSLKQKLEDRVGEDRLIKTDVSSPLQRWASVSRMNNVTRGAGYPLASWKTRQGRVRHVSSHDHDYLYYQSPLTGDFAVEADLSTFSYKDIHVGYGNFWAGPGYDLKSCLAGCFQKDLSSQAIEPKLTEPGKTMRVRLTVREGIRRTFVNGRLVYERKHGLHGDPWLSIHSPWYTNGFVENVAVSGNPVVPDKIDLIAQEDLPGWVPYFEESAQRYGDWRWEAAKTVFGDTVVLRGRRNPYAQTNFESLLRYHRPMLEDGVIEYDFLYNEHSETPFHTHPALDRCVFLLSPEGVQLHWITDGKYDRTDVDPANSKPVASAATTLPLKTDDWNHLELRLVGDTVSLTLNGQRICSRQLESTNQRTFGLFHYADQAETRVKNVRWNGNWPKTIPPPDQQELSGDPTTPLIAEMRDTPVVLDHDFTTGLPEALFRVFNGGLGTNIKERADGLHVTRPGGDGYQIYSVGPRLQLEGNFEITAEFQGLQTNPAPGGHCNSHLLVELPNEACRFYRRHSDGKHQVWSSVFRNAGGKTRYLFPVMTAEAATSGRFRLIRIGDKLHYLFAEHDSERFRLIDSQDVGAETTIRDGIRLVQETEGNGRGSVTWKRLTIRADGMRAKEKRVPDTTVASLNEQRDALTKEHNYDFTNKPPALSEFGELGQPDLTSAVASQKGFALISPGTEDWSTVGVTSKLILQDDFDVTLELQIEKLDRPRPGDDTAVMLQAEFRDSKRTTVEIKHRRSHEDAVDMEIVRRIDDAEGEFSFQTVNTAAVTTVHAMRVARRGDFAYFLYRERAASSWKLLGGVTVGTAVVPMNFLRMHLHTGGPDRESRVWLRKLSIAAESFGM